MAPPGNQAETEKTNGDLNSVKKRHRKAWEAKPGIGKGGRKTDIRSTYSAAIKSSLIQCWKQLNEGRGQHLEVGEALMCTEYMPVALGNGVKAVKCLLREIWASHHT